MQPAGPGIPSLSRATLTDAQEIVRQAKRYCPNLPFEPGLNEVYERDVPFYEDYSLVRLAPAESSDRELYGFYAPGDFRPIDGEGRVFQSLNAKAPLMLTSETVREYALLRLSFQLPFIVQEKHTGDFRLARTIRTLNELNVGKTAVDNTKLKNLRLLLADPKIEMIKEWDVHADVVSAEILRGKAYRVSATMMVHLSATEGQLIQVLIQIDPLGSVVIRTDTKGSEIFPITADGAAHIATARHTATTVAIQDWENLDGEEFQRMFDGLGKYGLQKSPDGNIDVVLRKTRLPFYTRYQLLEILRWDVNSYKRSYALFKSKGDDILIVPVTGESPVIHGINAEEGELNLTATTADEYLRFFCWAVRGEAGPFHIPSTYREIPISGNFSGAEQAKLKQHDFSIVEEVDSTSHGYETVPNATFRFRSTVVYESFMFEAWFAIENSGMVHMVEDLPVAPIPIQTESELGEEFLSALADPVAEVSPPAKPALTLAQRVWLFEGLTWFRGFLEWIPEEQTSVEGLRQYLNNPGNQLFITTLEKVWPLFPPPATPNIAHDLIASLWTSPPAQKPFAPKEIASQLTALTEALLPGCKVTDASYFSTGKPIIAAAQIDQPVVFRTALFKCETDQANQHDNAK